MGSKSRHPKRVDTLAGRFHVDIGPPVLFERVKYIIPKEMDLVLATKHFQIREQERGFPRHLVMPFRTADWELLVAETWSEGRFMETTWAQDHEGRRWFLVFTKGNVVKTVFSGPVGSRRSGATYIRSGSVFEQVRQVNQALMEQSQGRPG
jgi:hypothetical protein